jgi:hypothetical protein
MTIPVERWREEIFDVIDNCDARCISWNEQFRRVDKVLARFAAEVREAALQEAAEMCVSSATRSATLGNEPWDRSRYLCADAIINLKTPPPLPQPNVPLGNNPAPEAKP